MSHDLRGKWRSMKDDGGVASNQSDLLGDDSGLPSAVLKPPAVWSSLSWIAKAVHALPWWIVGKREVMRKIEHRGRYTALPDKWAAAFPPGWYLSHFVATRIRCCGTKTNLG